MQFKELFSGNDDLKLLRHFYDNIYVAEFPDPNERESYANIVTYLRAAGSRESGYHVVLAIAGGSPAGCTITDYFASSNTGVIEFLVVAPEMRGRGIGSQLLRDAEERLSADAEQRGHTLAFIAAEINDPFESACTPDNVDPFERARWWGRRGYEKLGFPYVQPALSPQQQPARNLMLAAKLFSGKPSNAVPAAAVDGFVRDYLIYAMRIDDPVSSPEYVEMARFLHSRPAVSLIPMLSYAAEDRSAPEAGPGRSGNRA